MKNVHIVKENKENEETRKAALFNSLNKGKCFFFTGSGISVESQIASVVDVLKHTCNKFLVKYDNEYSCVPQQQSSRKDYICNKVQPELFYSVLLECAGKDCVLEMWNCLKQDHFTMSYCPQPNFIHYFIVVYSYIAHVPVFTLNYDKMLESACEKLNIPFCVCVEAPSYELGQNQVIICKLHGNLKENSGNRVLQADIGTTMSFISKKNSKWLEYIKSFMTRYDICIWGYSGRDIDYYPFLREYANTAQRQVFWTIGNPKNSEIDKITEDNASLLSNINKISGYPSYMKSELIKVLSRLDADNEFVHSICTFDGQISVSKEVKEAFLNKIELDIDISDVSFDSDIFWMLLMKETGQNKALEDIIKVLLERNHEHSSSLTEKEMFVLLDARIVLAREQADFSTYTQLAKELKKKAKKSRLPEEDRRRYLEKAKVEYVSSLLMYIPASLNLKVPLFKRRYCLLLFVRLCFAFLNYRFHINKFLYDKNKTLAQECEIRSLSMDCRVPVFKRRTIKRLKQLRNKAYDIGNYYTLIGTNKYLARLEPEDIYEQEIKSFGTIVSDLSALSIINRDTNPDESLKYAKDNDNTLNIVKAIFTKKHKINEGNTDLKITEQDKKILLNSIAAITPKSLRQTLLDIGKRENLILG